MLRFLIRFALLVLVVVVAFALARAQTPPDAAVVLQQMPVHESGLSAKGSDITWPTAAAVTAWRMISVVEKAIDQVRGFFDRWVDNTGGRIPISVRYTAVSTHTEVDPDPTHPIRVQTTDYEGPDRRANRGRRKPSLVDEDDHDPNG